jgi:hypothetical protein
MTDLQHTLNTVAGTKTELTVIGENRFSICFEGENNDAVKRIKEYFGTQVTWDDDEVYDEECDYSGLYMTLN